MLLYLPLSLSLSLSLSVSLPLFPIVSSLVSSLAFLVFAYCCVSLFLHDQRQSRAIGQHARSFDHSLKLTFSPFMIS